MIQLTLEFGLRIWSCGCRSRYQGFWGRMLFMKRFFCLLDLVIVCGSIISTIVTETGTSNDLCITNKDSCVKPVNLTNQYPINQQKQELPTAFNLSLADTGDSVENISPGHSGGGSSMWTGTLRLLRFLQIIRIVRIERGLGRGNSWKLQCAQKVWSGSEICSF